MKNLMILLILSLGIAGCNDDDFPTQKSFDANSFESKVDYTRISRLPTYKKRPPSNKCSDKKVFNNLLKFNINIREQLFYSFFFSFCQIIIRQIKPLQIRQVSNGFR